MSNVDDYDILSHLGSDSCFYKVKNKTTAEICTWRAINIAPFTDQQLKLLVKAINDEKQFKHQNTVQVYSHILNNTNKTLYIVMKHYKYGNLKNIVEMCLKRNEILSEGFLWRLLYNVICILKLKNCNGFVNLESVFIDADFVVKIDHLDIASRPSNVSKCIFSVGTLLYQLCNLQLKIPKLKNPLRIPENYSNDFLNIVTLLLKDSKKINFDQILCNATVLLKSANQDGIFLKPEYNCHSINYETTNYQLQMENLQKKEAALKSLEKKLDEKELILKKRERMLLALENSIKDKMRQADLYLKRIEQNVGLIPQKSKHYEDLDTTLSAAECDESILPTSTKINLNGIKTSNFSRSFSERRIRFKGHSPLKDICNMNRNGLDQTINHIANTKCKKRVGFNKLIRRRSKLFEEQVVEDENDELQGKNDCRPISWSDAAKRQAFDMLRAMNAAETGQGFVEMKHTHL